MRLVDINGLAFEPLSHDAHSLKQVIFRNDEIPHLTQLAQARIQPGTCITPHAHRDMHEVFIVLGGHGRLHCSGEAHEVGAGSCIELAPGEAHAFENDGAEELVMVYFGIEV
jgi:mannose-6-phosphate isomerase-like protein (cupin superfamily)